MYQTLILDQCGPHRIVGWKEAVTNMFTGDLWVVRDYPEVLAVLGREALKQFPELRESIRQVLSTDAESVTVRVPAVAILRRPVPHRKRGVKLSKANVCARDNYTCQYCGTRLPIKRLEFEHVVPRSQGGKTEWDNIVMACTTCNSEKRNRTPEQAGMPLINGRGHVRRPDELPVTGPAFDPGSVPTEWAEFLN
jgi:5-methylcytosine-specific restriction endonuclease McrA